MVKTVKQAELARQFARGADSGSASNMAIERAGDNSSADAHLVGYGWAIYATRYDGGRVEVYEDAWRAWARERGGQAVHGQFAEIRKGLKEAFNAKDGEHPSFHALCEYNDNARPTIGAEPASTSRVGEHTRR